MLKNINIINAIGTNIGKTFCTINIIKQEISKGNKIFAIKPIISGFSESNLKESDIGLILSALAIEQNMQNALEICHTFLSLPLSPNIAAELEGVTVQYEAILEFCLKKIAAARQIGAKILIETAGGIMTPITNTKLMLDLTRDITRHFGAEAVKNTLVTSNYLGAISHTLTACKVMEFDEIIYNVREQTPHDTQIRQTIAAFTGVPLAKECP